MTTVVGLDLSLTGTGVATITDEPTVRDGSHVYVGLFGSKATGDALPGRAERLTSLAHRIVEAATVLPTDLVVIERPAFGSNTGHATDRAGLWWLVTARLIRGYQLPVVDVVNNHVKMYATGAGRGERAGKDAVLAETVRRYGHLVPTLSSNDEADSLNLAALGWHHLTGNPLVPLPADHTRAVHAVKWPTLNRTTTGA